MKYIVLSLFMFFGSFSLSSQTRNYDQELVYLLFGLRFDEAIEVYGQHKDIYHPFTIDTYNLLTSVHLNKPDSFLRQLPLYLENYYGNIFNDEIIPFFRSIYFDRGDDENGSKTVEILDSFLLKHKEEKKQRQEEYACYINEFNGDIYELAELRNITLPNTPWHLMALTWNFADTIMDFQRVDMDIIIERDVSTDYLLYISPFNGTFNGELFYGGIQTHIGGFTTKEMTEHKDGGKGGIFSRWSHDHKIPIGLEYVEMYENGLCESAGYEGEFCSVRRPYEWTKGTYTLSLVKEETIKFKGKPHSWVCMMVTDKKDGTVTRIGRLLFSGEKLIWRNDNRAFVEIYGFKNGIRRVPEAAITFQRPMISDKAIPLTGISAYQPVSDAGELNTNTPNCAYLTSEGTNVTVHINSDVKYQTKNNIYHVIVF
ncbi:MAG: hypothetical protein LBH72_04265 [Proteiniphilum sp.]|jgi:hypothetical protein|nr:hypothetical protein [Proteiniphilum sp.]